MWRLTHHQSIGPGGLLILTAGVTVSTKLPLVLVEWDEVFRSEPCWVPLDPKLYANEKKAHGWNMLKSEYVRWKEREAQAQREKEAEGQEQRRRR